MQSKLKRIQRQFCFWCSPVVSTCLSVMAFAICNSHWFTDSIGTWEPVMFSYWQYDYSWKYIFKPICGQTMILQTFMESRIKSVNLSCCKNFLRSMHNFLHKYIFHLFWEKKKTCTKCIKDLHWNNIIYHVI